MSTKKYTFLTTGYVSMDHIIKIKTPARVGFTSLVEKRLEFNNPLWRMLC